VGPVSAPRVQLAERAADLVVAEAYSHVWQGEGPSAGRACSFIRLGGCNLTCGWRRSRDGLVRLDGAWACDEAFTWHSGHHLHTTLARIPASQLVELAAPAALTVITGGEPLLHQEQPGWAVLLHGLLDAGHDIEIETNGTLVPAFAHKRIRHNVSPKLACSGLETEDRLVSPALAWHAEHDSTFKFVVTTPADVAEAQEVADAAGVPYGHVWIMPEGITPERVLDVARAVAPAVTAAGYHLTLRTQVLLYGEAGEPRDG
jgi:organic radical activating enzyme